MGINWFGAFGSAVAAPAGYHPKLSATVTFTNDAACGGRRASCDSCLGFVADPNLTGWTSYIGDYYLPGTPIEGWALQVGPKKVFAYTPYAQSSIPVRISGLVGSHVSYSATATRVTSCGKACLIV